MDKRAAGFWTHMGVGVAVVGLLWLAGTTGARSHNWYELACCSDKDCGPVVEGVVTEDRAGVHVKGHGLMSPSDSRIRWSRDDQDHLCTSPSGKLLCVYRRPTGM